MINGKILFCTFLSILILISSTSAQIVSNVNVTINGEKIDLTKNPAITLTAGETIPIGVVFKGEKDISEILKIKVRIDGLEDDIKNYVILSIPLKKDVNYISKLSLDLPKNIPTGDYIMQIGFSAKSEETQEIEIPIRINGPDPLIVNLISPKSNSVIKSDSVELNVETNRDAVCEYSFSHFIKVNNPISEEGKPSQSGYGGGGVSKPKKMEKQMEITGKIKHFQLIKNLHDTINNETREEKYGILVACTDSYGDFRKVSTTFLVNLSEANPICSNDNDCGTGIFEGSPFCINGNSHQGFKELKCINPGTSQSFCAQEISDKKIEECKFGCIDGKCIKDTTPPEAIISFDSKTKDIIINGYDDLDKNIAVNLKESCKKAPGLTNCDREYILSDSSNNTLKIKLNYKNYGNSFLTYKIQSLKYNDKEFSTKYNYFNINLLNSSKKILQNIFFTNNFSSNAQYNIIKKDKTEIKIYTNSKPKSYTKDGLKLVGLTTNKGSLSYNLD